MRRALCGAAMILSLGSCGQETAPEDTGCTERVTRMRTELRIAYDAAETPAGVADWVAPLYREFRRATDPTRRAALLDEGVVRAIAGCYGLSDAFRGAAAAPSGSRRAAMAKLVPDALASCRCRGVDVDSLGFLLRLTPAP